MPCTHEFSYFKPSSLKETVGYLKKFGSKAKILAGGTDLAVHIKEGRLAPEAVIDIKAVKDFSRFELKGDKLFIGSLVTFTEIIESSFIHKHFPLLAEASETVASAGVRNRATMVGNICSAVPSLDSAPALLVYDAKILLVGKDGERTVDIKDWFVAPKKTAIKDDEVVIGIEITKPAKKHAGIYVKLGRYRGEDLAQAGLGILSFEGDEYRVAFCAVGPVPKRVLEVEKILNGKKLSDANTAKAVAALQKEIAPITDIRASKEYRIDMMGVMLERGVKAANDRLSGKKVSNKDVLGG